MYPTTMSTSLRSHNRGRAGKRQSLISSSTNYQAISDNFFVTKNHQYYSNGVLYIPHELQVPTQESHIYIQGSGSQFTLSVVLQSLEGHISINAKALLDSGCTGSVISRKFIQEHQWKTYQLPKLKQVLNADGSPHASGFIYEYVDLRLKAKTHEERIILTVADLES